MDHPRPSPLPPHRPASRTDGLRHARGLRRHTQKGGQVSYARYDENHFRNGFVIKLHTEKGG